MRTFKFEEENEGEKLNNKKAGKRNCTRIRFLPHICWSTTPFIVFAVQSIEERGNSIYNITFQCNEKCSIIRIVFYLVKNETRKIVEKKKKKTRNREKKVYF